ncbi:MAG: GtrA family protein [Olegusella sp.]|nr:GtrA family protein [Olegusella sp.]
MSIKQLAAQFMKFGVVGVIAFAIDYGVLMLLSQALGMDPVLAAGISFTVSVVFNYLASMKYVFTHREGMSRRREFVTFVVLSVIGLGINELIIWVGTVRFGTGAFAVTAAKVVATAIVMVYNFVTRKIFLDAGDTGSSRS